VARVVEEEPWIGRFRCTGKGNGGNGCGRLIEVEEKDLYNTNYSYDPYYGFVCPECRAVTDIPYDKWPERIKVQHRRQ
jgi:hypothetical protein